MPLHVGSIMKSPDMSRVVCLVVSVILPLGCGGSPEAPPSPQPRIVKLDELPELGDPIGPLDQQRIEVAPPKGWYVPARSSRWIVRFTPSDQVGYPSIMVTAEPYEGISNVSRQNVAEFAKQIASALGSNKSGAKQAAEAAPIQIGRFVGVSHERTGEAPHGFKKIIVERLILDTVVAGRKYSIELRTREGDLSKYRPHVFAVAAGIKFLEQETEGKAKEPESEPEPESGATEGDAEGDEL